MPVGIGIGLGFGGAVTPPTLASVAPDMSALWSTRKQRNEYTGACLRVRRSSDNTEQDIGWAGGKLDAAALLAFTGTGVLDDGFVTTWYDQSGNGRDATQATAAKQMYVVRLGATTAIGSKGDVCVWNPAEDRYLSYTHPVDADGHTSMLVTRAPVNITSTVMWNLDGGGPYWQPNDGGNFVKLFDNTGAVTATSNTVARVLIATASTNHQTTPIG